MKLSFVMRLAAATFFFLSFLSACSTAIPQGGVMTAKSSLGLSDTHRDRLALSCDACHGQQMPPDDNATVVNTQCVQCHGSYETLAPLTKAKLKNPAINPHASHLGPEIACTVCHHGHQASAAYCVNCHTNFVMPIPGSEARATRSAAAS